MVTGYTSKKYKTKDDKSPYAICQTIDNGKWEIDFDNFCYNKKIKNLNNSIESHIKSKNFILCGSYVGYSKDNNMPILLVDVIHDGNTRYASALWADYSYDPVRKKSDKKGILSEPYNSCTVREEDNVFEEILVEKPSKKDIKNNKVIKINYFDETAYKETTLEDDGTELYKDFFEPFVNSVGKLSLEEFQRTQKTKFDKYSVKIVEGNENDQWRYTITATNGNYVTIWFFPDNVSDRYENWHESLTLITFEKGEKEISISDNTHILKTPELKTNGQKVTSVEELKGYLFNNQ